MKKNGVTMIELIIGIVIISITLLAFFNILKFYTQNSVNPMIYQQMNLIGESMLEEIQSKPFNKDINGFLGPFNVANRQFFDSIQDYNGFTMNGVKNLNNVPITNLSSYNVSVNIVNSSLGVIPNTDSVLITVTVTNLTNTLTLSGYKVNY